MNREGNKETITAGEAADILGVTRARVTSLCATGMLDARKSGGIWLLSRESVEARATNPPKPGRRWGNKDGSDREGEGR